MLEIRGIDSYERFSPTGGKSRTGEENSAEFTQLLQTGEVSSIPRVSGREAGTVDDGLLVSGPETSMYDGSGRIAPAGTFAGRSVNVTI